MKKEITTTFNALATFVALLVITVHELIYYEPHSESNTVFIDLFFESSLFKSLFLFVMLITMMLVFAEIFRNIWNRLFTDLFKLRDINLNEAYSITSLLTLVLFN